MAYGEADRGGALARMGGEDPASMMKSMMEGESPSGLGDRVDALADNPEFSRELEALLAKYEGGGEAPLPAPGGPPPAL